MDEEYDEVDAVWEHALFGSQSALILCRAEGTGFTKLESSGVVSYAHLMQLLGDQLVCRLPVRSAYGRQINVYVPGFLPGDQASVDRYNEAHPINRDATEFLTRWGFEGSVQGDCVIVAGDAIAYRDQQEKMVAANALTLPEVLRDHEMFVKPKVNPKWETIEKIVEERAITALHDTVPSAAKVAWLLHILSTGLAKEPMTMAAVMEARAKYPELNEAMACLANIEAMYFEGKYEDFTDEPLHPHRPVETPDPVGFSKRYGAVVH